MKSISLILRVLAIVFGIAAVALFFVTNGKLDEKQGQLDQARAATASANAELEQANENIASLESQLTSERAALAETKEQLDGVRSEMYTAKQELTRTQQQLSTVRGELTELKSTASDLRNQLVEAEKQLSSAVSESEVAGLREQISNLEARNEDLQDDLATASMRLQTRQTADASAQQAASTETPGIAMVGSDLTVASVNKEGGIVVFDKAASMEVAAGAEFKMIGDGKGLGTVRVSKVTPQYVIAQALPGTSLRDLAAGNTIKVVR